MTSGVASGRKAMLEERGEIRITVQCTQNKAHVKILSLDPALGMDYAEDFAGLLDGSSPFFIHKPGPLSPIGKCGICNAQLRATIEERGPENAEVKAD